jgi:hypothetical protein
MNQVGIRCFKTCYANIVTFDKFLVYVEKVMLEIAKISFQLENQR